MTTRVNETTQPAARVEVRFDDGPLEGAHRVDLVGRAPEAAWSRVAGELAEDIRCRPAMTGWNASTLYHFLGADLMEHGLRVYLVGQLWEWRAFAAMSKVPNPMLAHIALVLGAHGGELSAVSVASRTVTLELEKQEKTIPCPPYPFRWTGTASARRIQVQGDLTPGQRRGLADTAAAVARNHAWASGTIPGREPPRWDGDSLYLPGPATTDWLLQAIDGWTQLFWVDPAGIALHFDTMP